MCCAPETSSRSSSMDSHPIPACALGKTGLTPLWVGCAGGCHLDRKIDELIVAAGFRLDQLHTEYAKGPKLMTYMYSGRARPA